MTEISRNQKRSCGAPSWVANPALHKDSARDQADDEGRKDQVVPGAVFMHSARDFIHKGPFRELYLRMFGARMRGL